MFQNLDLLNKIVSDGLLRGQQLEVYREVFYEGPITAAQITKNTKISGGWKRLAELREKKVICSVKPEGGGDLLWSVTGEFPVEVVHIPKRKYFVLDTNTDGGFYSKGTDKVYALNGDLGGEVVQVKEVKSLRNAPIDTEMVSVLSNCVTIATDGDMELFKKFKEIKDLSLFKRLVASVVFAFSCRD